MINNNASSSNSRRFRIGRSQKNDIVIDDPTRTVSSLHAELFQDHLGRWYLLDLSKNGTFAYREGRWRKFKQALVESGERLSLGKNIVAVDWLVETAQRLRQESTPGQTAPGEFPEDPVTRRTLHFERDSETGRARRQEKH